MPKDPAYLEAEKKIEEAFKSGATNLDLSNLQYRDTPQLSELPESLGQLKQLQSLNLSGNQLTILPEGLGQLTQLQTLNLSRNQLTTLPESLAALRALTQLQSLDLSSNQLATLPVSLGQLTQLTELNLSHNQMTILPEWFGNFRELKVLKIYGNILNSLPQSFAKLLNLEELLLGVSEGAGNLFSELPSCCQNLKRLKTIQADECHIKSLPEWLLELSELESLELEKNLLRVLPTWLGQLKKLNHIGVPRNQITDIPISLTQLEHLDYLNLRGNPLNPALQSAYEAGLDELKAYLRSLENAEPLYEAKLVLVGEGNVGKTTLLKALKGKKGKGAPKKNETTTHGVEIDIRALHLPHPTKKKVKIQLNAWDFGGQDVYRVTHQFFSAAVRSTCWSGNRAAASSRVRWKIG